jgi:hypothetical protein
MATSNDAIDSGARLALLGVLFIWLVSYGSVFEREYDAKLVELFHQPWWRLLVGVLLFFAAAWCPMVGLGAAMVIFFYFLDLETLTL